MGYDVGDRQDFVWVNWNYEIPSVRKLPCLRVNDGRERHRARFLVVYLEAAEHRGQYGRTHDYEG